MLQYPRWKQIVVLGACAFFLLSALPSVISPEARKHFPTAFQKTLNLGLDLRGGSHLLLQLDFDAYLKDHLESLKDEVRNAMRKEQVGYKNLSVADGKIRFEVRPETLKEGVEMRKIIRLVDDAFTISDEGNNYALSYDDQAIKNMRIKLLEQSVQIVERRVNESGTKEPIIQRQGMDRVLVQVPGVENPDQLKVLLGKTAKMTFHLVDESVTPEQIASGIVPPGSKVIGYEEGTGHGEAHVAVKSEVALSGELLVNAQATFNSGMPIVSFQFNTLGGKKFGEITQANVDKRFAVVLDDKVITAPVIRSAILGGSGIIEGNFTVESANQLATLLRAGALPAPMHIIEERSVGPSLGADSIDAGKKAAVVSFVLVVLFMLVGYSIFGLFANIALVFNLVIIVAVLTLLQATLTMPGIAGIVLTLGMAVDANVLIFERIREEARNGKSVMAAIDHGFKAAFMTIFDSNLTTLIAAFLLFALATGSVKGFAVALSVGIISSMFTAITVTKLMVIWWFRARKPKKLPI